MKILEKQGYHLFILVLLVLGVNAAARGGVLDGSLWGLSTSTWLWMSILVPIIHQVYVVFCWRVELYYQTLSRTFEDNAFTLWAIGFMILFIARPVTVIGLAIANQGTASFPVWIAWVFSFLFLLLVAYLGYSMLRYFGIKRALGMDHFRPEEYREMPLVGQGIFRWSFNPMYKFGFLLLWIPGLLFFSKAALLAALFNHIYIWVHYYFTEKPDMRFIYQLD
jgi:hypothetical protein